MLGFNPGTNASHRSVIINSNSSPIATSAIGFHLAATTSLRSLQACEDSRLYERCIQFSIWEINSSNKTSDAKGGSVHRQCRLELVLRFNSVEIFKKGFDKEILELSFWRLDQACTSVQSCILGLVLYSLCHDDFELFSVKLSKCQCTMTNAMKLVSKCALVMTMNIIACLACQTGYLGMHVDRRRSDARLFFWGPALSTSSGTSMAVSVSASGPWRVPNSMPLAAEEDLWLSCIPSFILYPAVIIPLTWLTLASQWLWALDCLALIEKHSSCCASILLSGITSWSIITCQGCS